MREQKYDLEDCVRRFGAELLQALSVVKQPILRSCIQQGLRSRTSVGANYMEACCSESIRDIRHKIFISAKEAKGTVYWLYLIRLHVRNERIDHLYQKAIELQRMFAAIRRTCDRQHGQLQ